MINPWSDSFVIDREQAARILELAAKIPESETRAMCSIRIEPRAVIDTNEILASWDEGWTDEGRQEHWRLIAYPIMADGRILLLFEMCDEIYAGGYDTFHVESTHSHYRVLEYGIKDDQLELINRYRFMAQNADVATVFLYNGELRAAIASGGHDSYSVVPMIPVNDGAQFGIYGNINRFISNSRGDVIVAYRNNLYDEARLPLLVFNKDGETIGQVRDDCALSCADINFDAMENIWYHLFPSSSIDVLGKEESHRVALSGWDCFALSTDKSRLFLSFERGGAGSVQYILTRDKKGNYTAPIRFDFCPMDGNGGRLTAADCGASSSMKSWVLLNADGRLYLYDIDDCCENAAGNDKYKIFDQFVAEAETVFVFDKRVLYVERGTEDNCEVYRLFSASPYSWSESDPLSFGIKLDMDLGLWEHLNAEEALNRIKKWRDQYDREERENISE